MTEHLSGRLLVATPLLIDPNFWRSIVLVLQHDESGTIGVVLNRPTLERVDTHIPAWGAVAAEPGIVHFGGPVEPQVAIGLTTGVTGEPTGVPGLCIVDLEATPSPDLGSVRVYSGYAGWGTGQLEAEISEGSWYVVPASPDDPFDRPEGQWSRVLRRQQGYLSLVSTFPDDVSLN
ncbi:MAG TPA: YqgE/AlgH family protein [Acidimicrobiia bacterium]